jgi:PAS domain S-box-containing protein
MGHERRAPEGGSGRDLGPDRDQLVALLDSVTDAVFTLDREWRLTYLNRAAAERIGRPALDLIGQRAADVLPRVERGTLRSAYAQAFADGAPVHVEEWVPGLAGWYEVTAYPAGDTLTVVFRETTGRRRRELTRLVRERLVEVLEPAAGPVDSLLALACELRDIADVDLVEVWVRDHPGGDLRLAGSDHDDDPELATFVRTSGEAALSRRSAPFRVLEARSPEVIDDLADATRSERHEAAAAAGLRTSIHLPVVVEGSPPAVVGLFSRRGPGETDWFAILAQVHRDLVDLVERQRERHDLARFFTMTRDVFAVAGFDGYFKRVNPRMSELLGYPEEELLGTPFPGFVHTDDRAATEAVVEQLRSGQPVLGFRNRYRTADGQELVLSWDCYPIPTEGLIYCTTHDVTTELRERALEEAQRQLLARIVLGQPLERTCEDLVRAVEERFPAALVSMHRFDAAAGVLRLLAAPSLPPSYRTAVDPCPVGPSAGACGTAAHERRTVIIDDLATDPRAADGRTLAADHGLVSSWSEPVLGADGELLGTLAVHRDRRAVPDEVERRVLADLAQLAGIALIRDRTHTQLLESEQRFRLLSQATSDGIWDWDVVSGRVDRSESFATLFGYDRDTLGSELAGWSAHIHDDDRARVVDGLRAALAGDDATWQDTYRFTRADGTVAQVIDRGTIIRADGAAVRVVGAVVDDTDRYELEQQYLRAQRLESIGTLAGGIAHDLNNVLAPILMATDLLALDTLTPDQQEIVDTIASSAKRGAGMVRQVLTFARGVSTDRTPVDVRQLLADVERVARDTFPKSIDVQVSCPDDLELVAGDVVQLQQVLINIAVNARDAMPDGGTLRLAAQHVVVDDAYAVMVPGARAGRYVRVSVEDSGSGMESAVRERLFEPFFTTKEPGRGTGLGMSTSHAIVAAHLGFVEVDTEVGRGTRLHVHLPVATGATPTVVPRTSGAGEAPRGEGELVLVVDDETSVRAITQQTLEAAGYRVLTAPNGAEAVAVYATRGEAIALVVTDVMMPVMDGAAAINALRRIDPEVRVIAVSGLTTHLRGLSAPAPFLAKPFTTEALLRAVDAELARSREA